MWTWCSEDLPRGLGHKVSLLCDDTAVTYAAVLGHWQTDSDFREGFNDVLAKAPFEAFRWETPPLTALTATRPFEFVLLDSPGLARTVDVDAFAEHFRDAVDVVTFANLGKDAVLVVPTPGATLSAYGHLGAFVRAAPSKQRHALWQAVGKAMQDRLSARPVWLSTAGAGVAWLHVRLDDRPKYFGHGPYRSFG